MNGVEPIERGLARLRDFRWELNAQPLRELRLEVDIVYFTVPVPFFSGKKLSVPFLTMIKRVPPSPTEPTEQGR
ncbi:hypothetical protein A5677_08685 [Mycobacterium malmoense]|uniref:Uncharacterized protein n=1 Tax=Mycobacterium malmoense TaxID=1780 RepID=A0A1B9CJ02_MYCMA|nr:hypothetical protein [Mycobacterium malmoense]OCB42170.1 hypothetical protein A5677_08685 [Mycobacterium malmoense]